MDYLPIAQDYTPQITINSLNDDGVFGNQDGAPAANKRPQAASVIPNWLPNWNAKLECQCGNF